ncbi:hypothetical protein [Oleidesulfovibrio alaskensis]|jgi:hypothetical protein|uniref:hypothetical protein n=1 Tax=Oleidesulfovibrio alaskensis TaxID=58180 RepID=UPI001A3E4D2E|nr:hypothetical protein [Oleidesulfovibrio alaskensis]MBL3582114.1 hypothetical protein [Oleidesulfovibrio alaskensis]
MEPTDNMSQQERFSAYAARLSKMKESRAVREILERELLLEFIRINRGRINEFPLIEAQQRSISELFTLRGLEDPQYERVKNIITGFIQCLNKYGKALENQNPDETQQLIPELSNLEVLLVKSIQGVVFVSALTLDNLSETLTGYFGEQAYKTIDTIIQEEELGVRLWQRYFEAFIDSSVETAFAAMTREEQFSLGREGNLLVLTYRFDNLLRTLDVSPAAPEKSRIQLRFEDEDASFESRRTRKLVMDFLRAEMARTDKPCSESDLAHVSQLICIDPCTAQLDAARTFLHSGAQPEGTTFTRDSALFVLEQVAAIAAGVIIGLNVMREDFLRAPQMLTPKELSVIRALLGPFSLRGLHRVISFVLESQFVAILRRCFGEDAGKMQIRTVRERRVPAAAVADLEKLGMNRIRRNKIWRQDPDDDESMLFLMASVQELQNIMHLFQMETALTDAVTKLWDSAAFKVDIRVHINLELLSRTTTNLNQKLAEILARFGISRL